MTPFHDYSYYLQVVERNLKQLEQKCLHNKFDGVDQHVTDMMRALSGVLMWVEDVQQKPQVKD
jgi:hypothetical protein